MKPALAQEVISQSGEKPYWVKVLHQESLSGHYRYFVGVGFDSNIEKAKEKAYQHVLKRVSEEGTLTIEFYNESTQKNEEVTINDSAAYKDIFNSESLVKSTAKAKLKGGLRMIESYWEQVSSNGMPQYRFYLLYRKPIMSQYDKDFMITGYSLFSKTNKDNYTVQGLNHRILIPGWAQLYKKEKGKGIILLTTEAIAVAGILVAENMRSTNYTDALGTQDPGNRKIYLDNADAWQTIRNASAVAAGIIFTYSVIDALTSKGAKRYAMSPVKVYPVVNPYDNNLALSFNYKF
jgi:hypothetical protein